MKNLSILILLTPLLCAAGTTKRYGVGLPATGSDKVVHTIFTNPGEDASSSMNISFATPVGTKAVVEVTGAGKTRRYYSHGELCTTFDSISSKLYNGTNVYERHIFDKHVVNLTGLKPNTHYTYSVVADSAATTVYSETHSFKTAGSDSWKAAIIGDFHHYSPMWGRLDAAMGMLEVLDSVSGGFDWILSPGDMCAWGGSYNFWTELSEQPAFKNYMWATVQGNHDHMSRDNEKSDDFFRDSHGNPLNGYFGQEGVAYWFKYGDVLFFMLNNEAMRSRESLAPVFSWMEKVANENPLKYIIVVQHYEWLIGTDGSNSQLDRFRNVFDRMGLDLAISGNNHAYLRTYPLDERSSVEAEEGTFYVVTPSCDDNRGRSLKPIRANEDIIATRWSEGSQTVGGMIMDVNPERIIMTLYDRYGNVQDTFTIPSKI